MIKNIKEQDVNPLLYSEPSHNQTKIKKNDHFPQGDSHERD